MMANWGANHGVTVYGHVGADLITLASMLRIPVNMHNVPEAQIFRPTPGLPLAQKTASPQTTAPAPPTVPCINK